MCGITGIFYLDDKSVNETTLTRFNDSQKHRGPDGAGIFISANGKVGLAHRRLSILDVSEKAKQPMKSGNGQLHITYNGEIFNFLELKKELEELGHTFFSDSDTEVILAAYQQWGIDCQYKFNGMWAIAIWDEQQQQLFLSRDRFGIKPLHVLWMENQLLAFASETIAFKNLDGFERKINETHLAALLQNSFALEGYGKTIFQHIDQLPAGHYCIFKKGNEKPLFKRWWNTLEHLPKIPRDFQAQVAQFKNLFLDSCRLRLRSDVPIATALSGGLDSSSVYSTIKLLAQQNKNAERLPADWQTAFVATFPGADNDERKFAEEVIEGVNGKGMFTVPDDSNIADEVISTTALFDSVYISPVSVAVDVYKAMRNNGYKVSLDGHGVDEMLFGYPHMLVAAFHALMAEDKEKEAEEVNATYLQLFGKRVDPLVKRKPVAPPIAVAPAPISFRQKLKPFIPNAALKVFRKMKGNKIQPAPVAKKQTVAQTAWIKPVSLQINEAEFYPGIEKLSDLEKGVFREFHLTTLPTILRNFDRASMQNGIEIRMPFMDWRLVSFVFALPFSSKVGGGYTKYILREAMKDIVPESIRLRTMKVGFNAPMPMWFSDQLKSWIEKEVNSPSFSSSTIWNADEIRKFVEDKTKNGWTWNDCNRFWPYLNAHLITKPAQNG